MNLTHLKYAVEIAKTGSISRAAENLFLSQPNLSKAIKDLEASVGFQIFSRSTKGVAVTDKGAAFIKGAMSVLQQIDSLERLFSQDSQSILRLYAVIPYSYDLGAIKEFMLREKREKQTDIQIRRADTDEAIQSIVRGESSVGIIRFPACKAPLIKETLSENSLCCEIISEFVPQVVLPKSSPFAETQTIKPSALREMTEICSDSAFSICSEKVGNSNAVRIIGGAPLSVLMGMDNMYMWNIPVKNGKPEKHGLVFRSVDGFEELFCDAFVRNPGRELNDGEKSFLRILKEQAD